MGSILAVLYSQLPLDHVRHVFMFRCILLCVSVYEHMVCALVHVFVGICMYINMGTFGVFVCVHVYICMDVFVCL